MKKFEKLSDDRNEMSDGLDKLYLRFFQGKSTVHHPITDLLMIRASSNFLSKISEDTEEFRCFSKLPQIDSAQIQSLHNYLLSYPFFEAFEMTSFKPTFSFSSSDLSELLLLRKKGNTTLGDHYVVSILYYWLMFILQSKSDQNQLTINTLQLFIDEVESFHQLTPPFSKIESFLFTKFVSNFVQSKRFRFDNDATAIILDHISNDDSLTSEFSPILLSLIQRVADSKNIDHEPLLNILNNLIIHNKQRQIIAPNDYQKLAVILVPFVGNLDIKAIQVIASLSTATSTFSVNLKDSFILLPPLLLKKLQVYKTPFIYYDKSLLKTLNSSQNTLDDTPGNDRFNNHIIENTEKYEIDISDESKEIKFFVSENKYMLEDGFTVIKFKNLLPFKKLMYDDFYNFALSFANSLKKSDSTCIDNYFLAMFKLIDALEENNNFYLDFYVLATFVATKCSEKISLMSLLDMFNKKTIFYPHKTYFNNDDIKIRSIRFHVINLFAGQMDQLIPIFLTDKVKYPFLFTELIAIIININIYSTIKSSTSANNNTNTNASTGSPKAVNSHNCRRVNLDVFMTKDFVKSIFTVINYLITEYFKDSTSQRTAIINDLTDNSNGCLIDKATVFSALETNLYFLFELLKKENIEAQYFNSFYFISSFFGLSLVDFLQPFVILTVRSFLLKIKPNNSSLMPIASYFTKLFKRLKEFNDKNFIIAISKCLVSALSNNLKIAPIFTNALDAFVEITPFPQLLPLALNFLSIISITQDNEILPSKQLKLIVKMIKEIEGNNVSESTKLNLINLCSSSTALSSNSLFLIRKPSMVPLLFIAYGENHEKLLNVLEFFQKLIDFSISNSIACHQAGIDLILLEFIYNLIVKNENSVSFRGITFKLSFTKADIFNLIFPFLSKIIVYATNNAGNQYLIRLITAYNQPDVSYQVASFVLNLLISSHTQVSPVFPLGLNSIPFSVSNINPPLFNKSFSFITWIKIDRPISTIMTKSTPIITIKGYENPQTNNNINIANIANIFNKDNKESKETPNNSSLNDNIASQNINNNDTIGNTNKINTNTFSLFINRGILYYQFNDYIEPICQQVLSNQWFFIGFICQRTSQENSTIGLFTEQVMGFCNDVPALFFPPDSTLNLSIGGYELNNNDKFPAYLGPFGFANRIFEEEYLEQIEKLGPSSLENIDCYLKTNSASNYNNNRLLLYSKELDLAVNSKKTTLFPYSFDQQFCINEHNIVKLLDVFIHYEEASPEIVNIVIAIIKQVFFLSTESQVCFTYFGIIKNYLLKIAKNRATYQLYKSFYSILEVVHVPETMNSLFDNLLVNVELYSKGPPKSFLRIIDHWGHRLLNRFPTLFTRKNYFNRLVKMYVYLFNKRPFDNRYTDDIVKKLQYEFSKLLEEASKLGLTQENIIYFENFINVQTDNEENLFTFLSILSRNLDKIRNEEYALTLHHFAENENEDISQLAILSIHEMSKTKSNWMKSMMALAVQLKSRSKSILPFLLDNVEQNPGFIHLITTLSIPFDNETKFDIAGKLAEICRVSNAFKDIVQERFWFIWILIAAIQSKGDVQLCFLTLVSLLLQYVEKFSTEINLIVNVLQVLESIDKSFDYYQVVLDLFVNINAVSFTEPKNLIVPYIRALFFKFNENFYSNDIINLFVNGPFHLNELKINESPIYDILSLEPFLVQDFSFYNMNFGLTVDAGKSKTEGKLCNFLIQLIMSCEDLVLTKSTSILSDYAKFLMEKDELSEAQKYEQMNEFTMHFYEIRKSFNKKYCHHIVENITEIKSLIKKIKTLVFIDFNEVKQSSLDVIKNSDYVSQFSKKVTKTEAKKFANHFTKYPDLHKYQQCRQTCAAFCPMKLQIVQEKLDISDFIKLTTIPNAYKAKLYEFGEENDIDFIIGQDNFKIYLDLQLLVTVPFNKIEFIIQREKNSLEFFTSQVGSFYVEFRKLEECISVTSQLTLCDTRFSDQPQKVLSTIFENHCGNMTNFEFLIYLNYFSGASFHKKGKIPKLPILPLNGRAIPATHYFLPEIHKENPISIYNKRHQLEILDLQSIAKKKFKCFVAKPENPPKEPLKSITVRDLTLDLEKILQGGFFYFDKDDKTLEDSEKSLMLYIVTKDNEVHFIEVLRNKLRHVKTFSSELLKENCTIVNSHDGILAISGKKCQRFKPDYESQIAETGMKPPLISICGKTIVFVTNECELKKSTNGQNIEIVTTTSSRITCLITSQQFNTIVFGTEKCQANVFSLSDRILNCVIDISNDYEPQKVLITSGWGFIIIEAQKEISVYTINGTLIGNMIMENSILDWYETTNTFGEDFIVFIDDSNRIGIFEAAKPLKENIKYIQGQEGTIALTYHEQFECIVTLAKKEGILTFFPMPIDQFT
ncbi:hypothetical protein TRFO_25643 [Tritrichomonas foetus]|uniref:BEACH domain-containing protein n=1 Tax=Tritrichomonas foetus TaxID=1144522 RepID=A0A1J4K5N5_9EUKA|nr:hypothetical protein TRFO_25643 [Tritrichomonas foetus]|eukprot:OHT06306.1 hypothetical protein TRFO_25643 [Tritrichomonas foetus]